MLETTFHERCLENGGLGGGVGGWRRREMRLDKGVGGWEGHLGERVAIGSKGSKEDLFYVHPC